MSIQFSEEFCVQQFEIVASDLSEYAETARRRIDLAHPAIKNFLFGLYALFQNGDAVLSALIMFELIKRAEDDETSST